MEKVFIADFTYEASSESELSFKVGDRIIISNDEGDWWYGELIRTAQQGYISPSYGRVIESYTGNNPYAHLDESVKIAKRKEIFQEILTCEANFLRELNFFIRTVVVPLLTRDTQFKRQCLSEPSVAVSFTLIRDIFTASSNFSTALSSADSGATLADAIKQYAPSLQIFAQYTSENANCLHALKGFGRQFREFAKENSLPDGFIVETSLLLPMKHYTTYQTNFQEFAWLTPTGRVESLPLSEAMEILIAQTKIVDEKLKELSGSIALLTLQDQCRTI